jgi:hypothetical protein
MAPSLGSICWNPLGLAYWIMGFWPASFLPVGESFVTRRCYPFKSAKTCDISMHWTRNIRDPIS